MREEAYLIVSKCQLQLLHTRLDRIPSRQTMPVPTPRPTLRQLRLTEKDGRIDVPNRDIARQPKVLRLQYLVRVRVIQDSLGVNPSLVRECTVSAIISPQTTNLRSIMASFESKRDPRDRIHKWHVNLDCLGDQVLDLPEHRKVVLGFDIFGVGGIEACDKPP